MKRSVAISTLTLLMFACRTVRQEAVRYEPIREHAASAQAPITGNIAGHALLGGPLPGTTVTLARAGGKPRSTAVTDINGSFDFVNLPPGSYTIRLELPGLTHQVRTVEVLAGQTAKVDTTLPADVTEPICMCEEPAPPPPGTTIVWRAPISADASPWTLLPARP